MAPPVSLVLSLLAVNRLIPLLLLALSACQPAGDAPRDREGLIDDLGREVMLLSEPRRLIALAPNLTEIVAAAGGQDRLVAVSPADDHPASIEGLPRLSTFPLDPELTLSLQPDLLLANTAINPTGEADRMAPLGVPTFFLSFTNLADVPRALRTVGDLLGTQAEAESAARRFESRIQAVRKRQQDGARPRVLVLIGDEALYAFGAASYTQELIDVAGGKSITENFAGEGVVLSEEYVLDARPDVIIGAWGEVYDTDRFASLHPAFRSLPAVREGRVHSIDPDLIVRPGPRLADGAELMSALLREGSTASREHPAPDDSRPEAPDRPAPARSSTVDP